MMKRAILLIAVLAMASCGGSSTSASSVPPTSVGVFTTTEMTVGTGATAAAGNTVAYHPYYLMMGRLDHAQTADR